MALVPTTVQERRYYVRDSFNPSSPTQILEYMKAKGFEGGRNHKSKTGLPSTDEDTLQRLAKRDPFFRHILTWRSLGKLDSTYATGLLARADSGSRVHSRFTHVPSTWRLSSVDPNLQNIPSPDDLALGMEETVSAAEIRRAIVAGPDCTLVSADFSSIEAVVTGWYAGDPDYMRLARYGIHSYLLSHKLGRPADLSWSDSDLSAYLSEIKDEHHNTRPYKALKKTVYTTSYGGGPFQLHKDSPALFPSLRAADDAQSFYFELCPKLKAWQSSVRARADSQGYLGGDDHPYHFKHWFWDVVTWDPHKKERVAGSDWNRCVAFYPQSTTAGIQFDAALLLQDPTSPWYSGDLYHGSTPLRALIHDEILAECPNTHLDRFLENLRMAMKAPMPQLSLGHSIHVGPNWASLRSV